MPGLLVWTRHSDTVFSISCQCQMWWSRCFHKLVFFHIWSRTRQRQSSYRREHRPNTRRYPPVWDNPVHPPSSPKAGVDPLACISNACTPLGFHPCSRNCPAHESYILCSLCCFLYSCCCCFGHLNKQTNITNIHFTSFRCNSNLFRWYTNLETNTHTSYLRECLVCKHNRVPVIMISKNKKALKLLLTSETMSFPPK